MEARSVGGPEGKCSSSNPFISLATSSGVVLPCESADEADFKLNAAGFKNRPDNSTLIPSTRPSNRLRRSWSPVTLTSANTSSRSSRGAEGPVPIGIETPAFCRANLSTAIRPCVSALRFSESAMRLRLAIRRPPSPRSRIAMSRASSPANGSSASRPIETSMASLLSDRASDSFAPHPIPTSRKYTAAAGIPTKTSTSTSRTAFFQRK